MSFISQGFNSVGQAVNTVGLGLSDPDTATVLNDFTGLSAVVTVMGLASGDPVMTAGGVTGLMMAVRHAYVAGKAKLFAPAPASPQP